MDKKRKRRLMPILWAVAALLSLALAAFFGFYMFGYGFTATLFLCSGALFAVLFFISLLKHSSPILYRICTIVIAFLLILGMALFTVAEIPVVLASRGDGEQAADYLIVLGAGINGETPSLSMINRLVKALEYLEKYPDAKAVVTGGQGPGESITEAEAMRIWLERQGIAPERILKEDMSTSTLENIVFALEIIENDGGDISKTIAITSSEYHLYRAKQIASSLGINTAGVPAKTTVFSLKINHFIREGFGVIHMWVFGLER